MTELRYVHADERERDKEGERERARDLDVSESIDELSIKILFHLAQRGLADGP